MSDNFQWTDELVAEYAQFFHSCFDNPMYYMSKDCMKEFIKEKSKEKDIPKPDWEIISIKGIESGYKYYEKEKNMWKNNLNNGFAHDCSKGMQGSGCEIHCVKRLSDGEVFTVGNIDANWGRIRSFEIDKHLSHVMFAICDEGGYDKKGIHVQIMDLDKLKPKVPLFTTEDGVEIFEGDCYFSVNKDFRKAGRSNGLAWYNPQSGEKYFSTKEKQEEYITLHKPVDVRLNELFCYIHQKKDSDWSLFTKLEHFFKSKINI